MVKEIVEFLKKYFDEDELPIQAFTTRNVVGDYMKTIYDKNGITIDYCEGWNYLEIFGISDYIFNQLKRERVIY